MKLLVQKLAAATAILAFAFNAHAAIGSASAADVTLAGQPADAFAYEAGWNPHAGPNGDTSGFGSAFDGFGSGDYNLLDKYEAGGSFTNAGPLTFTFTGDSGTSGMWTVTNTSATQNVTLDLIFAIHAGNQGGAWLFDNETINAGQTLEGTWQIMWTVGMNGAHPDFSNLTLFGQDMVMTPVPEPATYAMLLAGLGVAGVAMRRRRKQ